MHDAFIVKYSATQGQRFLPVHTDEGQWSLTLALNDLDEYDGGGHCSSPRSSSFDQISANSSCSEVQHYTQVPQ